MDTATLPTAIPSLDLRGTPCPLNFIRTKLKLEQLPIGSLLEVWLDGGEPIEQVPDSLRMEGYQIRQIENREDFFAVLVHKPIQVPNADCGQGG